LDLSDEENEEEEPLGDKINQTNFANKLLDVNAFIQGKIEDVEVDAFD
jgi:hypothetical protein